MTNFLSYDTNLGGVVINVQTIRGDKGSDGTAVIQRTQNNVTGPWETVRGCADVSLVTTAPPISDYEFTPGVTNYYQALYTGGGSDTSNINPTLTTPWLMNLRYPFLNIPVRISDASDITRTANGTTFQPIGRTNRVAVATMRSSRQYTLTIFTETDDETIALDALLSTGDTVLLQVPPTYLTPVLGGYFSVGDTVETRQDVPWGLRWTQLPLTEVEPPDGSVIPIQSTWETLTANYATWSAVVAGLATWNAVVELVGAPGDVIVN